MTSETSPSQPHRRWASSPTVLDRETVFQGAIFNIDRAQVRLHDGRITHRQIVTKADGAIAIPITSRGTLIMVIQHRVGLLDSLVHPDCQVYEFPAGHIEFGEQPLIAAQRELLEETGYSSQQWLYAGYTATVPGYVTELGYRFLCTNAEPTQESSPGQFEDVRTVELSPEEVADLIAQRSIISQSSISSALFAFAHLQRPDLIGKVLSTSPVEL